MSTTIPLVFALSIGFAHAFEADHLLAISNIVTKRKRLALAIKDGIFWGLGHTSTIFLIGALIILARLVISNSWFEYFEQGVGAMLIGLGGVRLYQMLHPKRAKHHSRSYGHGLAYGVGFVHGLAGSGAVVLLAMTEVEGSYQEMTYLLSFGVGSMTGMLVAAGLFNFSLSRKVMAIPRLQGTFVLLSGLLCIVYGGYLVMAI